MSSAGPGSCRYDVGLVYRDQAVRSVPDEWVSVDRERWAATGNRWPPRVGDALRVAPPVLSPAKGG